MGCPPCSMLVRPQRARGAIEYRIHELEAVGGAKALGEHHRLVDCHAVRHLRLRAELVERDQQHGTLDRIEQTRLAIAEIGEPRVELLARTPYALDQRAEVAGIGARHVLRFAEFLYQVLPRRVVQLPAVERLQRELARHAARAAECARVLATHRPISHRRAMTAAISSALSIASPPLLPSPVAARSSACSSVSTVRTPKATGTPVSSPASCRPRAASPPTYSTCGVSPRITQPSATTAS